MTKDKEYIERAVAIERARNELDLINKSHWSADEIVDFLKRLPAADVAPVRHGRWNNGYEVQNCSECGYRGKRSYKFCPNCGAKMDGGADDA